MVDVDQVSAWLIVAAVYILLPFLLVGPNRPRHAIAVRLQRLGTWALPRLQARSHAESDDDIDPLTDPALVEARRREQAYADLRRLRDLVQSDASMSATRQIANRIAYDRLREQVAAFGEPAPVRVSAVASGPRVVASHEVLDVDWRH